MLIGELLEHRAAIDPEGVFWECGAERWSYAHLSAAADAVAGALRAEGLPPGSHVAVCSDSDYAYACVQFGAARAGLVLAHLNARYTAAELAALIEHSDAELLFFSPGQAGVVARVLPRLRGVRRFVQLRPGTIATGDAHPESEPDPPRWAVSLADWLARGKGGMPASRAGPDPGQPFQLLYTSGTTGDPKGALISHRAKVAQGTTHALNLGLVPGDRVLSALPLYHQYAQWLVMVSVPLAGATVVVRPAFEAEDTWKALRGEGITHLPAVPTTLYRLLDHPAADGPPAPQLRCIVYGAAPIDPGRIAQLRLRFPGVRLFQGFGQTETGYCLGLHDADHERRPDSLGKPDLFSSVRLLDPAGQPVREGAVGEIVARTPYLMNGYHKDPEATAAYFAFGAEWGRTGDLAWRDANGYYTLAGRSRDLVISGGVNIYPAEVERVLQAHAQVAEAAVFGVPDADWGEALVAAVLPAPGAAPDEAALEAHCRESLAGFKVPRHFVLVDELPTTANGKVRKHELRRRHLGHGSRAAPVCGEPENPP